MRAAVHPARAMPCRCGGVFCAGCGPCRTCGPRPRPRAPGFVPGRPGAVPEVLRALAAAEAGLTRQEIVLAVGRSRSVVYGVVLTLLRRRHAVQAGRREESGHEVVRLTEAGREFHGLGGGAR